MPTVAELRLVGRPTGDMRVIDTANVPELMERFPELRVPTGAPESPVAVEVHPLERVAALAELHAQRMDELAAAVEDADRRYRAAMQRAAAGLAELHVALDELAAGLAAARGEPYSGGPA